MKSSPPALMLIDLQKGMQQAKLGPRNNPEAELIAQRLLAHWRAADWPVVHVRHMSRSPESVFWPGQPGAEFQAALQPMPSEHVQEKHVTDAFANSGLERWLRVRGIESLVLLGVSTNYSVEASARSAGCLGFHTRVVQDACFTFDRVDLSGVTRSAAEIHLAALTNLSGEYAEIVESRLWLG